jgi:hypothetical protein
LRLEGEPGQVDQVRAAGGGPVGDQGDGVDPPGRGDRLTGARRRHPAAGEHQVGLERLRVGDRSVTRRS